MELLRDGVIAALSAIGLTAVIWVTLGIIFYPRRRGTIPAVAVVSASGDGGKLEHTVRALERSRYEEGGFARIIILDRGLSEQGLALAELLCRDDYAVSLCTAGEIEKYIE